MSNLLKEAIIDAKALREAALKNAETSIVEKYSDEVRETLEQLLEQDELGAGLDLGADLGDTPAPADPAAATAEPEVDTPGEEIVDDVPLAATDNLNSGDGKGLNDLPAEGDSVEVTVNLDALQEAVAALESELSESEEFELNEEEILDLLSEDDDEDESKGHAAETDSEGAKIEGEAAEFEGSEEAGLKEDTSELDAIAEAIMEKLTVDMGAELSGWAGRSSYDMKHEIERELAHRRSTDVQEELEVMKKAQEELVFENKQLKEQNNQYKQATNELKKGLQEVNLSNARLLYTNRVLRNTSLNERQKETIVEAISRAGSVTEARTIFDTLQSTAQSTPKRGPQSLSEAINRRSSSSVIRASRHESAPSDPLAERMKRLAGIK